MVLSEEVKTAVEKLDGIRTGMQGDDYEKAVDPTKVETR